MSAVYKPTTVERICPKCAGKGIVSHRHITNKRNKKVCERCEGEGQYPVVLSTAKQK
jgi:DnaJ-class molecular chaperone